MVLFSLLLSLAMPAMASGPAEKIEDMHSYSLNGFTLSGAEYWVFVEGKNFSYPDDVLWGFQGEWTNDEKQSGLAPLAARECALIAYNKLNAFLQSPPAEFVALKNKGATPRFFLWTNDYTAADPKQKERANQMWHWNSGAKDYRKGYWKWESTLTHSGECLIPSDEQILAKIQEVQKAFNP